MIARRQILGAAGVILLGAPLRALAQQKAALPRLGFLHPASVEASAIYPELLPTLAQRGYEVGKTLALETRSGNGKPETLPALAASLVDAHVDVLLVVGAAAVRAALAATRTLPIVAIDLESDPVRNGWMKSLSRPGGNVTGFFLDLTGMSVKWLQLLREATPTSRRISLLWDTTTGTTQLEATRAAAAAAGVTAQTVAIEDWAGFDGAIDTAMRAGTQAFVVLSSPTAFQYSSKLAEFTLRQRIPAISPFLPFAQAGGLMSYGPDLVLFFRRVAATIARILAGTSAADVPAEQPTRYQLAINRTTAEALRLALPRSLLLRADEVIQ